MKKTLLLATIILLFLINFSSANEKNIYIEINEDGTSTEQINWKINVDGWFSYIPKSEWGIEIPKNTQNIVVSDKKEKIEFEIKPIPEKSSSMLTFRNKKTIFFFSKNFFNIQYKVNKNPIVYDSKHYYKRTFTRSETDDLFSLQIKLPENAEIVSLSPPTNEQPTLNYNLEKRETKKIEIEFKLEETEQELTEIISKHYKLSLPKRYSEEYAAILEEADKGVEFIEELYGFPSPHVWELTFRSKESNLFEEQIEGTHLSDGRIGINPVLFFKNKKEVLTLLLHETVHGFNSKFLLDRTPNFWWDEGTALYVSYSALDSLGYDSSKLRAEKLRLAIACEEHDKLIPRWSPNQLLLSPPEDIAVQCKDGITTDEISLGYAQSYFIIETLVDKYGKELFKNFHNTAESLGVEFSGDREILNNQINFVLSKAVGEGTTQLLNELNIPVEKIQEDDERYSSRIITGLPILEDESETQNYIALTIMALTILVLILLVRGKRKT